MLKKINFDFEYPEKYLTKIKFLTWFVSNMVLTLPLYYFSVNIILAEFSFYCLYPISICFSFKMLHF